MKKFLLCINSELPHTAYILHTQEPKFLAKIDIIDPAKGGELLQDLIWYDQEPDNVQTISRLMREVGEFYNAEISSYSTLSDFFKY